MLEAFPARVILFILTAGQETGVSGNSGMELVPGLLVRDRDRI